MSDVWEHCVVDEPCEVLKEIRLSVGAQGLVFRIFRFNLIQNIRHALSPLQIVSYVRHIPRLPAGGCPVVRGREAGRLGSWGIIRAKTLPRVWAGGLRSECWRPQAHDRD